MYFCKLFLDNIIASLHSMPFGIRWISKQLVNHAKHKFPTVTSQQIDLLVGGLIFLRFIVPGIVSPESHGIVTHVSAMARRNLILIAKVIQNLANGCTFNKKEYFMLSMNPFITDHTIALHDYFVTLLNVGDAGTYYKTTSLNRVAPQQIERTVTISPNELYSIHRYILKHQKEVLTSPDDPMIPLLATLGPAPEPIPRRQNKFVLLNVYSIPNEEMDLDSHLGLDKEEKPIQELREKLRKAIALAPTVSGENISILELVASLKLVDMELAKELEEKLASLPTKLKEGGFKEILQDLEKDYQQRQIVREAMLTERIEQLEALEHQKREVARLLEEKKIYSEYLTNVQLDAFLKKIKNKSMIGPFAYTLRDLEKRGVIQGNPSNDPQKQGGVLKISCTTPGAVNITAKYKKVSRFFELQLSELMDDLVLHDTVVYDDITFDIRKLISFINRNITA